MTPNLPIRICASASLRGQPGLSPLQEILFAGGHARTAMPNRPEHLVLLDRPGGDVAVMEATVDRERIAMLGPILVTTPLEPIERQALWQAAIEWARTQDAVAIQLAGDRTTGDCEILTELGYSITTEIGSFVCDNVPWMIADDPLMRTITLAPDLDEVVDLVRRTLVDTLDIPEAIPFRRAPQLIQGWLDDGESWTLVAQAPEGAVGLLVAHRKNETAEITYVGVAVGQRRLGWGTRLFAQFLKWARDQGVTRITVIVDRRNSPAIQLYQRFGFREENVWMPVVFQRLSSGGHSVRDGE